jgi:hypothetical protein
MNLRMTVGLSLILDKLSVFLYCNCYCNIKEISPVLISYLVPSHSWHLVRETLDFSGYFALLSKFSSAT